MNFSIFHTVVTVLVFIGFIAVVAWAFSSKNKQEFQAAARIPLEEDESDRSEESVSGDR